MPSIVNDARVPQQVHVAAVSAQSLTSPAFRIRVLLLCDELARLGVAVEPHALFSPADAEAFYGAPLVRRAPVAVRARRRLAQELAGLDAGTVLLQRQADLLPSLRLERLLAHGRRLVWDVDD